MIKIKSQELRDAVQAAYEFDKEHGKLLSVAGLECWYSTYSFDTITRTYWFQGDDLIGYEDVV